MKYFFSTIAVIIAFTIAPFLIGGSFEGCGCIMAPDTSDFGSDAKPANEDTKKGDKPAAENKGEAKGEVFKIGNISINMDTLIIEVPGEFSQNNGVLEYIAVQKTIGKEYESLLSLDARPSQLQAALILCGLKTPEEKKKIKKQGEDKIPEGDQVILYVEWEDPKTKKTIRKRVEDLIYEKKTKKTMPKTHWVFTGSYFVRDESTGKLVFAADLTGSIIAIYHDPDAILDVPLKEGADDEAFVIDKSSPAFGTKCKLILDLSQNKAKKADPDKDNKDDKPEPKDTDKPKGKSK